MKLFKYAAVIFTGLLLFLSLSTITMAASTSNNSSYKTTLSDTRIKTAIVTSYTLNTQLNPFDFNVKVNNGNVALGGSVADSAERDLAVEIAKGVDGVKNVSSTISVDKNVKPNKTPAFAQTVNDATSTAAIKSKLFANSNTSALNIHVKTFAGIVTLDGTVDNATEKQLAGQIAKNTNDVVQVNNNLQVANS